MYTQINNEYLRQFDTNIFEGKFQNLEYLLTQSIIQNLHIIFFKDANSPAT